MAGAIYKNPITFAVMATVAILIGSVVTMAYPMLRADMHPKLDSLKPITALQLAGRDVYQREGCVGCHTQMIRPLPSEVARYGDFSKAGEFAYEHPFLWGSKRTGPDLGREGGLRPDKWQHDHFANPQAFFARSNMPSYGWLKGRMLDAEEVTSHMAALAFMHPELAPDAAAIKAELAGKDELDALVAYMQQLGTAVSRRKAGTVDLAEVNPLAADKAAKKKGKHLYEDNCAVCHGEEGEGVEGVAPSLMDERFLEVDGDMPDAAYLALIQNGSDAKPSLGRPGAKDGGMTAFGGQLSKDDVWSIIAWLRAHKAHEQLEEDAK
ncbi:MAG: cbb3-type cytochrome c oxidase subunit II [Anaeromyxobacter sp.]|nr:cbb3-type cytochrome c oxidase subunit II [Anaeromyxobacter sp.]MBL0274516.1 cbb3-type cytochrome c oxidase subunit II [Anaeromyxobacter sp.]